MKIIRRTDRRNVYTINRVHDKAWQVVKVLNMYDNDDEAYNMINELYNGEMTEEELLKDYIRKGKEIEEKIKNSPPPNTKNWD
jgi:hypothetical protein